MTQALSLPRKCFRVKVEETGQWIVGHNGEEDITTPYKDKALIFSERQLETWEDYEGYGIVWVEEDEIMMALGETVAPRLPGFEEAAQC